MPNYSENAFSSFVRTLGKGKTGSRSLNFDEAKTAMSLILAGEVEDVQLGAFLMLLRVKEESAEEIAGFVSACRDNIDKHIHTQINGSIDVDIDWSSYAGKRRQPHWFLLATLLLANNGYRVFIHGAKGHTEGRLYTEEVFQQLTLPIASSWQDVSTQLDKHNLSFMPIAQLCPTLHQLIQLRPLFGLRSPVHTLCRLLNPLTANTTLQSVFHPAYTQTHHQAAQLLGEKNAVVFKGDAGEVEYRPQANLNIKILQQGNSQSITLPRVANAAEHTGTNTDQLQTLWSGEYNNHYAEQVVIGTAAIALYTKGQTTSYQQAQSLAEKMWHDRSKEMLLQIN